MVVVICAVLKPQTVKISNRALGTFFNVLKKTEFRTLISEQNGVCGFLVAACSNELLNDQVWTSAQCTVVCLMVWVGARVRASVGRWGLTLGEVQLHV